MNCPRDPDVTLLMTFREGIEIDYCPRCRGVWLDRGELDKLIERSGRDDERHDRDDDRRRVAQRSGHDGSRDKDEREHKRKKRKSFLGDLFDFD